MAGNRPADWHVLDLDKDPTPGDPDRVRKLAKNLHDFADDVSRVLRDIKGMAGEDAILSWAGKTADTFIAEFEDAPGKLKKLKKSYNLAGDALASFWPDLEEAQTKADKALRDGRAARDQLATAQTALSGANDWVQTATKKADSYDADKNPGKDVPKPDETEVRQATRNATRAKEKQESAQGDVDAAQSALDAAKKLANQAKGLRDEAARRTVKKLEEASDAGIPNRHWWEEATDWVADHWDEIVTVCKVIVAVVGIIVMIVGGPLGWLVFAAALVVMADTIRKVANGEAGWGDLIWAALDCIPATKGITSLAKLGKLWKAGGLKALGAGAMKGIGGGLKGMLHPKVIVHAHSPSPLASARFKRLAKLKNEGHGPQRHLFATDAQLKARLGEPKLDAQGNYTFKNDGHVRMKDQKDPETGTVWDSEPKADGTPKKHRCGPYATRFNNAEDMIQAERVARSKSAASGDDVVDIPMSELYGNAEYGHKFTGFYVDPSNPADAAGNLNYRPVDFREGSVKAVFRSDPTSGTRNVTLYPNPQTGRHP
ncbi:putative T7SS-secreted protein [Streptomyces longisporoflavus]|uniref:putative T7SS-secreted protein n=1 Tax=Streptomyces longisporoflavus TaxID=28044 RepID=UPI001E38B617|nr:hypothetical protein [Streptomyces longisporoflavus]